MPNIMKCGSLNLLEPSGPHRACYRTAFTLFLRPSLHFTSPNYTSLHPTTLHSTSLHLSTLHFFNLYFAQLHFTPLPYICRHFTSSHLNFTQLHFFTTLSFGLAPLTYFLLLHFNSHHYTIAADKIIETCLCAIATKVHRYGVLIIWILN
jgi:hypothetical protein